MKSLELRSSSPCGTPPQPFRTIGSQKLPLSAFFSLDSPELKEVAIEACNHVCEMAPCHRCDQHEAGVEVPFDHRAGSLSKGSCTADRPVSSFLPDGERMTPESPMYGLVHRGRRFHAEIPLVPVDRLSRFREVDTTVTQ